MRKIILHNGFSPGDIVMMTAAVRDLHRWYPGQFLTDVRTACPELWENNPHITPLEENDPDVAVVECSYPLINRCDWIPYHCLHALTELLSERLQISIKPTDYRGDIHLSELEKSWYSQVYELTQRDIPFWIVAAGGKYDITIKWWATERFQAVVDGLRGKIQFVQVGQNGHHHPKLNGAIDLRGQTTLRELVRLVYHAQGVLCPVTALMHLAAAVETKEGTAPLRPCVVIAGGREPPHWEAYPGHQFIHTIGSLPCCATGGCWRDRVQPLGDGDERDHPDHQCLQAVNGLPRCMDLINPAEVIRRIELYFAAGSRQSLTGPERRAAGKAVRATATNDFDRQPLNLHSARPALEQAVQSLTMPRVKHHGRGIVICAGGAKLFVNAWVGINMLRQQNCRLPIQLWYLGAPEMDASMKALLQPFDVECIDALKVRRRAPVRVLGGWQLKPYAILHAPFREVLLLDADNVPVVNPEFLFDTPEFRRTGAIFWPDFGQLEKSQIIWDNCGLARPPEPEFESGQIAVDKARCGRALRLSLWFNEHSDFYYRHLYGDKETFHLAFCKLQQSYSLVPHPIHALEGTMCQHDFTGRRIFQHRNTDKWDLLGRNQVVPDFRGEAECRAALQRLKERWDGGLSRFANLSATKPIPYPKRRGPRLVACMISCADRQSLREQTLQRLAASDWGDAGLHLELDANRFERRQERQTQTSLLALQHSLDYDADYVLFLEDDLDFNQHLRHNLEHWMPLRQGSLALASLYNPGVRELAYDVPNHAAVVSSNAIYGSQAFILPRRTAAYVLRHWDEVEGMQDIKLSRLAGRLPRPIYYHVPSLVQHLGKQSVWGGRFHQALDFAPDWKF